MLWKRSRTSPQAVAAIESFPEETPAEPSRVVFDTALDRAACEAASEGHHFYHAFDLGNGLHIAGDWDI